MKKCVFLFVFLLVSNIIISQKIVKEQINGTWKVERNLTKTTNPNYKDIIEGFLSSTFRFEQNGNFELYSPNRSKFFFDDIRNDQKQKMEI